MSFSLLSISQINDDTTALYLQTRLTARRIRSSSMHSHFESGQTLKFPEVFRNIAQFFAADTALVDLVDEHMHVFSFLSPVLFQLFGNQPFWETITALIGVGVRLQSTSWERIDIRRLRWWA
jgi:hypothetical protein